MEWCKKGFITNSKHCHQLNASVSELVAHCTFMTASQSGTWTQSSVLIGYYSVPVRGVEVL